MDGLDSSNLKVKGREENGKKKKRIKGCLDSCTHMGRKDGVPGCWLWLGPDLAIVAIWE